MVYLIEKGGISAEINSFGAELCSLKGKDGFEYMWQGESWPHHAPVLFPLCGKIKNNEYTYKGKSYSLRGHGFAPRTEFLLLEKQENKVSFLLTDSEATLSAYPFSFELIAEYAITEEGLVASYTVKNKGEDTLPYMFGWHPAFNLWGEGAIGSFSLEFGDAAEVKMHPLALERGPFVTGEIIDFPLESGKYYLNETEIYSNDTLILTGSGNKVTMAADGENRALTLTYTENLPYFCVWKEESSEARFLCLEPWSNSPCDGIADENFETRVMERLGVGEEKTYAYTVKLS